MRNKRKRSAKRPSYVVAIFITISMYAASMLLWPLHAIEATPIEQPNRPAQTPALQWPTYGQSAVGAVDYGVLETSGTQSAVPMASITKIVTALVVLDSKPLADKEPGPSITFTADDAARYNQYLAQDGTVAPANAGTTITQQQVMQAMLVSSANNYADTLAIWAYGSMDAYLLAANSYLAEQKLANTSVADASGFSPNSKSTASDLAQLGMIALSQPAIADAVSQKTITIPGVGTLNTTNILLGKNGVTGIKTGTTDEAGSCLLFASEQTIGGKTITIVGATLGGPNHPILARDVSTLITSTASNFQETTLAEAGQVFAEYKTPWGTKVNAITKDAISNVTWIGDTISQTTTTPDLQADHDTTDAGTVVFTSGELKQTSKLQLSSELSGPSWIWRITHPLQLVQG